MFAGKKRMGAERAEENGGIYLFNVYLIFPYLFICLFFVFDVILFYFIFLFFCISILILIFC